MWTKELPKVSGWYWVCDKYKDIEVVFVDTTSKRVYSGEMAYPLDHKDWKAWMLIEEPDMPKFEDL